MDPVENVKTISIGRWGCDRCHLGYTGWVGFRNPKVKELYPWSEFPELGPGGPHNWKNIMGYNGSDKNVFNISYLTDSKLTHSSPDYHADYPYHEKTSMKQPDSLNCTPCHQGSGRVRYNYSLGDDNLWLPHAKGQAVECTFCHGMDGGYTSYWPNSTGYTYGEHSKVAPPPDEPADPYLAHQTCSNISCHGHISNSKPDAIDNAYPICSDCHPVSFGSDVPQWLNTSTGQPRDVGGHPGETGHCSSCGDVDNNTILNILDVRILMNYISDPVGYPINESLGDVDGNSIINSGDVQLLLNHIFNPEVYPLNCICEQASEEGIVNCSFCHNSFHSIFDESNVLRCNDCHSQSDNYPMVHWNFFK